jgi:two-component system, LuxR family, response regulator FixJ
MTDEDSISIVEDNPQECGSMAALAQKMGFAAVSYPSAKAFLNGYDVSAGGCVVADLHLRGVSGLHLLEGMSRRSEQPPMVMVVRSGDVIEAVRAMRLGAITVLQRPCRGPELADAIAIALILVQRRRAMEAQFRGLETRMRALSACERDVLALIVAGRMNKWIARELNLAIRTVEARRHSIMAKLGVRSVAELVQFVCDLRSLQAERSATGTESRTPIARLSRQAVAR